MAGFRSCSVWLVQGLLASFRSCSVWLVQGLLAMSVKLQYVFPWATAQLHTDVEFKMTKQNKMRVFPPCVFVCKCVSECVCARGESVGVVRGMGDESWFLFALGDVW